MSFFVSDAAVAELMPMDDSVEQELEADFEKDLSELGLNADEEKALGDEAVNFFGGLDLEHKEEMEDALRDALDEAREKENEVLNEANEEEALEDEQMAVEDELLHESDLEAAKEDEKKVFLEGPVDSA